jgi:hypothetical protein
LPALEALQFKHAESLTWIETSLADVAPPALLVLLKAAALQLQAYAPTYNTLIDPPYELAPKDVPLVVLKAPQLKHVEALTRIDTPLADVPPPAPLLLLVAATV